MKRTTSMSAITLDLNTSTDVVKTRHTPCVGIVMVGFNGLLDQNNNRMMMATDLPKIQRRHSTNCVEDTPDFLRACSLRFRKRPKLWVLCNLSGLALNTQMRCCFQLQHSIFHFHRFSHYNISSRIQSSSFSCEKGLGMKEASEMVVADPILLDKKIASIRLAGPHKLQVIADFDATLTKFWVNGTRGQSSHGLLQQGNPEYDVKRQQLYDYYHPLEFLPTIGLEEKTKLMEEWWGKTHALLVEGGLTYESIRKSVADANIAFREGVAELFEFLEERDIPVLIFSAGLADIIEEVLRSKLHRTFKNVRIVSNRMVFDDDGHLVSFKGKLIHSLNKNEHALDMAAPVHEQPGDLNGPSDENDSVKKRTNVLLLGDHTGDLRMSDGLNYDTRISVGFLNHNIENSLSCYREAFDVVFVNDAPMWGVIKLASQMCSSES